MKKIIAVLMVFMTLLCSASCGNADDNATRGYVSFPNSQIGDKNTSGGEAALYKYHTFEMMCKKATNVVIATYNMYPEINANQSIVGGKSIYKRWNFDVQENIFGETEENINVYMPSLRGYTGTTETGAIYFDESNVHMYHGHTYLLFLTKFSSPYYSKGDYYTWMYATTIDLDDISNSTMYSQPIHKHTENIDMKRCTKDDLIAYVRELVKDNKPAEETLKSDNLEEIVRDAKQVVHIKIEDPLIKIQTTLKNSETWSCKVIDTLKGDIKEGSTIKIMFIGDVVVPGKEYIVTLETTKSTHMFNSTNSLRPVSEKREIKKYID